MDATWTVPKNIRQIGEAHAHYAVYIEDYVSTYIKQVVRLSDGGIRQGALVGKVYPEGEKTVFVIQGIVTDKELYRTSSQLFSPQGMEALCEQSRRFFADLDVIGRVMFEPGKGEMDAVRRSMFSANDGTRQIFLHVDCADGTQEFCIGTQGAVELIESYYIYYERNEAMQNYLIAYNEETRRKVEEVHDIISGQARAAMGEMHMPRVRVQKDTLLICATCALLICVTLLGIININQYQKMCEMEASFNHVLVRLGFHDDETVPVGADAANRDQSGGITVSDITPEDGAAPGQEQDGLFAGLPVYVSDAGNVDGENGEGEETIGDNGEGLSGQDTEENEGLQADDNTGEEAGGDSEQNADGETEQNTEGSGNDHLDQSVEQNNGAEQNVSGSETAQSPDESDTSGQTAGGNGGQSQEGSGTSGADTADVQQNESGGDLASGETGNMSGGYREYIVQRGDTLTSISMLFYQNRGMIRQICELNGIENADNIVVGQKILLP